MSVEKFSFNSSPKASSPSLENKKTLIDISNINIKETFTPSNLQKTFDIGSRAAELFKANLA
ncbi:MAG: hypothetical protein QG630_490 [Patescibacteria group bacterium]|nr:hypothetical protein [Patescibacteria group bacterium]